MLNKNQNDFGGHLSKKDIHSDALEADAGIDDAAWEQYTETDLFKLNQIFRVKKNVIILLLKKKLPHRP